jgi:deferrochelatase/peroxidase EfeB
VLTVALGARALEKLGLPDECVQGFPAAFLEGMSTEGRTRILGDTGINAPEKWEWGREPHDLALLAYGQDDGAVAELDARVQALAAGHGMAAPHRIELTRTKKPAIEPFGFVDGVSQPVIRGSYQSFRKNDPIHLVEPGEFVIGYPDNRGNFPPEPTLSPLADPANVLPIADKSREFGNSIVESPRAIGRNGSFLVIRQLEQDVKGFWDYCWSEARRLEDRLPPPYDIRPDFIAAKLVGRWRDGSSLVRNPYYPFPKEQEERAKRRDNRETAQEFSDESAVAASGQPVGSETARPETNPEEGHKISAPAEPSARGDNDFLFGTEDPQALRCPFGAHIRRANPRDSLMPGSMEQVSISNRHRILRVGRLYEPAAGRNPGLLFMCLNGDIERQFEFVQQTWLVSPAFHGLVGEQDPLTSSEDVKGTGYVIPTSDGPVKLKPLPAFVKMLGGGYFFMPGRSVLAFLGGV